MRSGEQELNLARNPWLDRLERAGSVVTELQEALNDARRDRDELILLAVDEGGLGWVEVARAAGVVKSRIGQILGATQLTDA